MSWLARLGRTGAPRRVHLGACGEHARSRPGRPWPASARSKISTLRAPAARRQPIPRRKPRPMIATFASAGRGDDGSGELGQNGALLTLALTRSVRWVCSQPACLSQHPSGCSQCRQTPRRIQAFSTDLRPVPAGTKVVHADRAANATRCFDCAIISQVTGNCVARAGHFTQQSVTIWGIAAIVLLGSRLAERRSPASPHLPCYKPEAQQRLRRFGLV